MYDNEANTKLAVCFDTAQQTAQKRTMSGTEG
jgi:hypothetical protein